MAGYYSPYAGGFTAAQMAAAAAAAAQQSQVRPLQAMDPDNSWNFLVDWKVMQIDDKQAKNLVLGNCDIRSGRHELSGLF